MSRKKWTAKTDVNPSLTLFREKRKWQIALRRYLLMESSSFGYAPYFGLDIMNFRKWIEIQFDPDMNWDNFSINWQLDHLVPVACFDFSLESDLRLCWNFTNIRAENLDLRKNRGYSIGMIALKAHFQDLYDITSYPICLDMLSKLERIERSGTSSNKNLSNFILERKNHLEILLSLSDQEYKQLNSGSSPEQIVSERVFIQKFR